MEYLVFFFNVCKSGAQSEKKEMCLERKTEPELERTAIDFQTLSQGFLREHVYGQI